ncbi:histidine phosphatase family protein [Sporosarcina aquimarina]|uniref:histidine phosphatase family protein n=1 Tax=Sporosarcina aquimarina TaxID=114975 RepID=UPI00203C8F8E|nr:histidine phosphatase family protein [Sporosarcina aquimarina]MCM3757378.1 histidine phosphatase family protein [Sporosarcina aquimarina]
MSTHVYLTRHGETEWNTQKLMQGWKDSPLTEKGTNQAKQLAVRLSDVQFDAIYSSTSGRAVNTAELIKGKRLLRVIQTDRLREISFGNWEGKTFEVNERESPEDWQCFWQTPHLFSNNTVEDFRDVQSRMVTTVNRIVTQHPYESVCIVSHSIALKLLIHHFENKPLEDLWSTAPIPPTSLTLLKVNSITSEFILKYDTSHLE